MIIRSVPIIDVAPFLSGSPEDKRRVAGEVGGACEEIGFLIVKGHGVPRELVNQMYDVSKRFFDLPLDEKMETHGRERSRGYGPSARRRLLRLGQGGPRRRQGGACTRAHGGRTPVFPRSEGAPLRAEHLARASARAP
jgi:hypothetical protein